MISMSFIPWERMRDLNTIKCVMSLLWEWRSSNYLYKETQQMFPSNSVSIHSLDLRASTYQRTSQYEPPGSVSMAHSSLEPPSYTGQAWCKSQQLAVGHAVPELESSFLPSLSNCLLFKSYMCPYSDALPPPHLKFISH